MGRKSQALDVCKEDDVSIPVREDKRIENAQYLQ